MLAAGLALLAGCGLSEAGGPVVIDDGLPATGPLIIDGQEVPREQLLVVLHIGHSNMAGRSVGPEDARPYFYEPHPQLWSYTWQDAVAGTGPLRFRPAVEPLSADPFTLGAAGPGMALLRSTLARAPDAKVVSIGRGHSGRDLGGCSTFQRGGLLYDLVMLPAQRLKGRATFVGVFTMFGATEFEAGRSPARLAECMVRVAADLRAGLDEPELPFMVGDYEAAALGEYLPSNPGPAEVIQQLRRVVAEVPRSALIPTEDLPMQDDHHFDLLGHKIWGERALSVLQERGWAPWAAPPP